MCLGSYELPQCFANVPRGSIKFGRMFVTLVDVPAPI